jgi:putative restriction endonuclease
MADSDAALRAAALSHVAALENRFGSLSWEQIAAGFEFRGDRVLLANKARGIFRPRQLTEGALSIKTTEPRAGRERRYDDQIGGSEPFFRYRYQGTDPEARDNRDLRECRLRGLPIIYFYAVAVAVYRPIISTVVGEDPASHSFFIAPLDANAANVLPIARAAALPIERRYDMALVRRRLHQDRFRAAVLTAYGNRCGICRLRHPELLDAAHIIPDAEKLGEAKVPNGLSLCKLHHAAFDSFFIGITADFEIRLRSALLDEVDGPMLEHGLRAFHRKRLQVPEQPLDRPDRDLLELRWQRFQQAG